MRYVLLVFVVAGCSVDHTGLGPSASTFSDAGPLDAALRDAALPDAELPDAASACEPNPCLNGGSCSADADSFRCVCPPRFRGATCQLEAESCEPDSCRNGGTCADSGGSIICSCPAGFSGEACETNIDDCTPNPCMNGGACTDGVDAFTCACSVEFVGPTCNTPVPEVELAFYDPVGSQMSPERNPLPVTDTDPRVTASSFENVTYGDPSGANYNRRPVLMTAGALDVASTYYVTVTLAPTEATDAIALSRITYSYAGYVGGATGAISARTSADGFASTVDSEAWAGASSGVLSFDMRSVPPTSESLELRLYMHDLSSGIPGVSIQDWADLLSTQTAGDGMRVFGRVVAE